MDKHVKVSVVIPYWQDQKTIYAAVESVLGQTEKSLEVIIVDSGGMNEGILPDDSRIRVISAGKRLSAAAARKTGVMTANGRYVAFLDADDMWQKDKLRLETDYIERKNRMGEHPLLVYTGRQLVREDGEVTGRYIPAKHIVRYRDLLATNSISCSSVLMRRETAEGLIYPEGELHEDYAAWLALLQDGGYAAGIDRPLLLYRMRKSSRSGQKTQSARMHWKTLRFHGFSCCRASLCMVSYVLHGIKKYYF